MLNIARLNSAPEIFYSLQGEGSRCGTPAVFLRLAGCNLACKWCDTKHSWGNGIISSTVDIAKEIGRYNCSSLVITGGEPLLQQPGLEKLIRLLPHDTFIEIETNGTILPTPTLAQRVNQWNISPKLSHAGNDNAKAIKPEILGAFAMLANSWFKFVVSRNDDWEAIASLNLPQERIILMPCATTRKQLEEARDTVVDMCLRHQVRLGDRLHLTLWDDKKGV